MNKQLSKFAVGDLAIIMQSPYTSNCKIVGAPALIVKTHATVLREEWRYTVLAEDKIYTMLESELQ
jgi:hypothetical protein